MALPDFLTTAEVADYLRLKERKVYELVREKAIPCARVTGKLLFPRRHIDAWVAGALEFDGPAVVAPPPVLAGSHDPLLEWAVRASGCGLALLAEGSRDGLGRLAAGQALMTGLHLIDSRDGSYDPAAAAEALAGLPDLLIVQWAWREQGLMVPRGNPHGIATLADALAPGRRLARRQAGSGSDVLLSHLMLRAGLDPQALPPATSRALTETELAAAIVDGKADCGLGIAAVARRFGLDFLPLHRERFDLALRRRDYFEPAAQALFAFARTAEFAAKAEELGGYAASCLGRVVFNR
ncbi:substrate-binding domain-containing protein [Novispirillum sp. DQ9]|uniref:substrate-binding domain-containing protein n=1 Tax=Novispirillum sp. DQ9 TaxID=3398612 RepID=UPI003C7C8403